MDEIVASRKGGASRSLTPAQVILVLLAAAGIGAAAWWWFTPRQVRNITGAVTRGGKPLAWPGDEGRLHVIFVPEVRLPDELPTKAECDSAAGTFRVDRLRAGSYRVAVHMFDEHHIDALGNQFDPGNSPVRHKVEADNQVIAVDLPETLPRGGKR